MPILVGLGLALLVVALGRLVGFDRDRAFYPVVLIVVASFYLLFATMAGGRGLAGELAMFALFAGAAVVGFRTSLWLVAAGLVLHGLFDLTRHLFLAGHGVPAWWPAFCGAFDVAAGLAFAAILLLGKRAPSKAAA